MKSRTTFRPSRIALGLSIVPLLLMMACADGGGDESADQEAPDVESMSREERIEFRRKMQADRMHSDGGC